MYRSIPAVKTKVTVVRNNDGDPVGFEASGHSDDRPAGQNVTCASITTVFEYMSELAEYLPQKGVHFQQDPESTHWSIVFDRDHLSEREAFLADRLTETALSLFQKIRNQNPEACDLNDPGR
jgi:uncharacterized protein YsxB (DUF464 family)